MDTTLRIQLMIVRSVVFSAEVYFFCVLLEDQQRFPCSGKVNRAGMIRGVEGSP